MHGEGVFNVPHQGAAGKIEEMLKRFFVIFFVIFFAIFFAIEFQFLNNRFNRIN